MSIPLHDPSHHKRLQTLGVRGRTAAGGVPEWEAGTRGAPLGSRTLRTSRGLVPPPPHLCPRFPADAPEPLVGLQGGRGRSRAASRNARRRRRRWPWRRLRELRSLRLRALGPLPPQQSAAQPRSHHCSLTSASGIRRFRGPPSRTPFPCCHCEGAGRQSLTESRGRVRHSATTEARPRARASGCLRPGDR